jgi:hypothetical protein
MAAIQTEFEFTLPRGYVDDLGNVHRQGAMRLATAMDEITPLRDPRVRSNEAYLVVLLLSQVITRLGTQPVTPAMIERLYSADMAFLQDFYRQINDVEMPTIEAVCPNCGHEFQVELPPPGES